MSNLKHLTVTQLREEIGLITRRRAVLERQATINEEAARILTDEAGELRKKSHDMGQRECWVRIYLAQKT